MQMRATHGHRLRLRAEPPRRRVAHAADRAEKLARGAGRTACRALLVGMKLSRAALDAGIEWLESRRPPAGEPEPARKVEVRQETE